MENIPPNRKALKEALNLSEEILRNLELSEVPLNNIALKACRLARLLNESTVQEKLGSPIKRHLSREKNIPAVRKVSFSRSGLSESCEVSVPEGFIFFLPIS